jgi:hypothetical protein
MMGSTAPFMVMETLILSRGIWSKSTFMSSTESMATPALPTSPHDAGMVRIVTAVGGQIEGHGKALLAGGQVAPVKGVGLFGRGETGILANGPGAPGIHGGHGTADIGGETGQGVDVLHALQVRRYKAG